MDYFLYNTDARSIAGPPRYRRLIDKGIAATGGPRKYGEELRKLSPGDTLLMYENGTGVVAVGSVREYWDGKTHPDLQYYRPTDEDHEYRIAVNWFRDLSDNPISVQELRQCIGTIPPRTVSRIVKARRKIERLVVDAGAIPPRLAAHESDQDTEGVVAKFEPETSDRRIIAERQIRERRGQQQFRNSIRKRYGDHCLVTACQILDLLEAAHIKPYRSESDNHPENGLLLRADIHVLFDLDLLGIEPQSLQIAIAPELANDKVYGKLAGKPLRCASGRRPSHSALELRYKEFKERTQR